MRIGVFDSGIGGLSVLKNLVDSRLFSEIIYYGDTARVPYGNKDRETIRRFCLEALEFFTPFGLDMLIVACNTASAYSLDIMQENSSYPIIGVIEAGVLSLSNKIKDKDKQILIIGTKATISSNLYELKLRELGYHNLLSLQTGLFVPLVEEGVFSGELLESAMRYYFNPLLESRHFKDEDKNDAKSRLDSKLDINAKKQDSKLDSALNKDKCLESNMESKLDSRVNNQKSNIDSKLDSIPHAIILGCTHFPLIKNEIARFFYNKPLLIHSGEAIVEYLQATYALKPSNIKNAKVSYYASDNVESLKKIANIWLSS